MSHSRDIAGEAAGNWRTNIGSDSSTETAAEAKENISLSAQVWDEMRMVRCNDKAVKAPPDQELPQGPPPLKDEDYKLVPKVHVVKAGEVLNRITREHLGAGATEAQVKQHMADIVRVNGLVSADVIKEKQTLKLPGETKDGGFAVKDAAGNVKIAWKNGSIRENNANGTGFSKQMQPDGTLVSTHWGPRPGDHYKIESKGTNQPVLTDVAEETKIVPSADASFETIRKSLLQHSRELIKDEHQRTKFEFDMNRFDQRAQTAGLSRDEVRKTCNQIDRLLVESHPKGPLTMDQRIRVAEQVMSQCARPTSIDQGNHNTCSVSSIEVRTYSLYPSSAARIVADSALTGTYTSATGITVHTNPKPRTESFENPPKDGDRSHASQIFQVAAVNLHYEKENQSTKPPKHLRYVQFDKSTHGSSTGEGVFDYKDVIAGKAKNPTLVYSQPELWDDELVEVSNAITGRNETGFVIAHTGEGKDRKNVVGRFDSVDALRATVADLNQKHMLPASIRLHSGNDPFYTDSDNGAAGGSGGWHEATILKYNPLDPNFIEVDNSWGSKSDHRKTEKISVSDMYAATREAGTAVTVAFLEQAAAKRRADGQFNLIADLELLRQKKLCSSLSSEDYVRQLESDMKGFRDHNGGTIPDDDKIKRKVSQVTLATFTGDQIGESQVRILHVREQGHVITPQAYEDELYKIAIGLSKTQDESIKTGVPLAGADAANFDSTLNAVIDVMGDFEAQRRDNFIKRVQKDAPTLKLEKPAPPPPAPANVDAGAVRDASK